MGCRWWRVKNKENNLSAEELTVQCLASSPQTFNHSPAWTAVVNVPPWPLCSVVVQCDAMQLHNSLQRAFGADASELKLNLWRHSPKTSFLPFIFDIFWLNFSPRKSVFIATKKILQRCRLRWCYSLKIQWLINWNQQMHRDICNWPEPFWSQLIVKAEESTASGLIERFCEGTLAMPAWHPLKADRTSDECISPPHLPKNGSIQLPGNLPISIKIVVTALLVMMATIKGRHGRFRAGNDGLMLLAPGLFRLFATDTTIAPPF